MCVKYMADTVEISGLEERIQAFGKIATNNPMMQKRIQEVIRKALAGVRKNLQSQSKSGMQMQSDPRGAYKAIRMSVYKKIFGGNVSILSSRKAHGKSNYTPPRKLKQGQRGGNRRERGPKTERIMSYSGIDREFIMRFLNEGTTERKISFSHNGNRETVNRGARGGNLDLYGKTINTGKRGNIAGRDWFGNASRREIERAAEMLDGMINDIVQGIMY